LHHIFHQVPAFDPENPSQRRHHFSRLMTEEMLDQLRHACWFLHGSFSGIALPYARYSERQYATWLMRIFDQHDRFDIALLCKPIPPLNSRNWLNPNSSNLRTTAFSQTATCLCYCIGRHSQRRRKMAHPLLNNPLPSTTGPTRGET